MDNIIDFLTQVSAITVTVGTFIKSLLIALGGLTVGKSANKYINAKKGS